MDALINAAAHALSLGDPLGALKRVALRSDPEALALRGIAMAQLGEFSQARSLLQRAAKKLGPRERARCLVAEAEIALASRDLGKPLRPLSLARATLEKHGDRVNAAHARLLEVRRLLIIGKLAEAERLLARAGPGELPRALQAIHALASADLSLRRLHIKAARGWLAAAGGAARASAIPALIAEVDRATHLLAAPAARVGERVLDLEEVEALRRSPTLLVDACRRSVDQLSLARRPVLFALARALADGWPGEVPRDRLIEAAFGARRINESHRARLRVEVGRLRKLLRGRAAIEATALGFALRSRSVTVLVPPLDGPHAEVLALLADGEAWSSSALALALGKSQRSLQRALDALAQAGKVQSFGEGRARRWTSPPVLGLGLGFTTLLLLPSTLANQ